ncbi:MAG: hypothetical protein LUQ34_03435 [Euryarchaeota archaeon]|nr:hypothetical protein [Euryarchaeota archaeon]
MPFPVKTLPDRSDALNTLVITWICAREKARRGVANRGPYRVLMHWKTADTIEKTTIEAADRAEVIHIVNGVDMSMLSEKTF